MTEYTPGWFFQVCAGSVLLFLAYLARLYSVDMDTEQVAVSTGFALRGVANLVPVLALWQIGLAGAGLALLAFPLKQYRIVLVVLAAFVAISGDLYRIRPTYGTDSRVLHSTTDVPGVPISAARPNYMLKSSEDFERGRAEILGHVIGAVTETFGKKAGDTVAAVPDLARKTPMSTTFSKKITKSFDLQPITAEELELTRQSRTSGTLRESRAIVRSAGILDPR
ncbi:hypothetical protein E4T66_18375 [Sinimarinibacterium sp. CAU 1509]|uniref:hypothetical protein n=1 Tax=Sinimarinibacterium sp. CAU 1509 TaxID=2562283 RepID=UPI0010AC7347|nr:hypothetical protein [Sinimarinibacterium sp. CAU 1509]TJY57373.1 hypothetical protein E4T66_18375 [Sinimarinibacterium sp. CAU 1509]